MEKLESKVKNAIDKYGLINKNERVLVGLSGGADSVALLHVLLKIAPERGFELCAAHLNHGIRGAEARRWSRRRGRSAMNSSIEPRKNLARIK